MDRKVCMSGLFLCNRKFRGIPCYIKRHWRAKDAHSREDADCRKRLRGMPEVVKTHLKKYTKNTGIA